MKTSEFLHKLDEEAIAHAIAAAERRTSGEIRVYVSERKIADALARAQLRFHKLGMDQTRQRNGVLLYFAPVVQQFAVIGDSGIHAVCGQAFWEEVAAEIRSRLRSDCFQEALIGAVEKVGEVLARHFPPGDDNSNELPNTIVRD